MDKLESPSKQNDMPVNRKAKNKNKKQSEKTKKHSTCVPHDNV